MVNLSNSSPNWRDKLDKFKNDLEIDFWDRFTRVSDEQLIQLEGVLGRTLPAEFKDFYRVVGHGDFIPGLGFYSPEEMIACIGAPIYFVNGSLMVGEEWATVDEHKRLWLSQGKENPNPDSFTEEKLALNGVRLYDLFQIGADGSSGYFQAYLGPSPAPFQYCLLIDSGEIEMTFNSFTELFNYLFHLYFQEK